MNRRLVRALGFRSHAEVVERQTRWFRYQCPRACGFNSAFHEARGIGRFRDDHSCRAQEHAAPRLVVFQLDLLSPVLGGIMPPEIIGYVGWKLCQVKDKSTKPCCAKHRRVRRVVEASQDLS